jgi:ribonucleotide reductase alpha subunit
MVSNLQKTTSANLCEVYSRLRHVVSDEFWEVVRENAHELNEMIDFHRDYKFDYFGFKTLQKAYLLDGERPQHMYIRVAIGIWGPDLKRVRETYDALSTHQFTHASPTLFNAGTKTPQLCSCFLTGVHVDSLDDIFQTLHKAASISKYGGGIGLHVHAIRSKGSLIKSTNGSSDGLVPMLKVANEVFNYINQCFVPETLVYTRDNGIQRMDSVKVGDHLVTRDGTFKRVNEVFVRSVVDEPMVTLTPEFKIEGMTCTRVHEIFALRKGQETPGFYPAAELEVGDRLAYPIPNDVVDYPFDVDFCRAYGRALAGGVKTFQKFVETNEEFRTDDPAPFFDPRFLNLPRPKTLALVYGLLEKSTIGPEYMSLSVQVNLVPHIRYLCLRLGILIQESDGVLKIPKHQISCVEPIGILWTRLTSVGTSVYTGDVYDFNMESNHNYTTDCGLVHNSGKRKGSCAIYIEPHHADIMSVLDLKRNQGDDHLRARDLFYGLWISDVFMERVEASAEWSLFDPGTAPGLEDVWGDEYRELYAKYEREGRAIRTVPAHELWFAILRSQIETGVPYMVYKDAANRKSNQQNLGTIKCSNLCVAPETEVLTSQGYIPISELDGKDVKVWNGEEWSNTVVKKTSDDAELIKVTLNTGFCLECTRYHKFYLTGSTEPVCAENLKIGDLLVEFNTPVTGVKSALDWLAGIADACGWTCAGSMCIAAENNLSESFLEEIRAMLLTLGVYSAFDGTDLVIPENSVALLVSMGFHPKRMILSPSYGVKKMTVSSVEITGRRDATYCFDEPKRHMGVFNGILTGNCSEIIEFTAPDEVAVCNLGSISLPAFVKDGSYDYAGLHAAAKILTRNLDRVIDVTFYPITEARTSNMRHRPIGLGVQGLADVFFLLKVPFDSGDAAEVNRKIFATIYHAAVETSCDLAEELAPYPSFPGSPASSGKLQFDLWGVDPHPMYDWEVLRQRAKSGGMRNSLLLAPMPTASTAQTLGNTECFEPITSNLYSRTTLAGTFTVVNRYLLRDLIERGLWTSALKNQLVAAEGSVQSLDIPEDLKRLYKTAYEMSMKTLIDMAADRGIYVDQSMSLNMFVPEPSFRKLSSMHFYAWKKGLKTGMYYMRSKAATGAKKITVEPPECVACSG